MPPSARAPGWPRGVVRSTLTRVSCQSALPGLPFSVRIKVGCRFAAGTACAPRSGPLIVVAAIAAAVDSRNLRREMPLAGDDLLMVDRTKTEPTWHALSSEWNQ